MGVALEDWLFVPRNPDKNLQNAGCIGVEAQDLAHVSGVNYNYRLTTIKTTASFRPPWGGRRAEKISPRFLEKHYHPVTLPSQHLLPRSPVSHAGCILEDRVPHEPLNKRVPCTTLFLEMHWRASGTQGFRPSSSLGALWAFLSLSSASWPAPTDSWEGSAPG